jgi:hypothetical protein
VGRTAIVPWCSGFKSQGSRLAQDYPHLGRPLVPWKILVFKDEPLMIGYQYQKELSSKLAGD